MGAITTLTGLGGNRGRGPLLQFLRHCRSAPWARLPQGSARSHKRSVLRESGSPVAAGGLQPRSLAGRSMPSGRQH